MDTTTSLLYNVATNSTVVPDNGSDITTNATLIQGDVDHRVYAIVVPLIWGILIFVGTLGNALVIYTLLRHGDKNATNYFVINLAISDFCFLLIVVPFTTSVYVLPEWIFGNVMCKITTYMIYVTLHATCLTLMAMTIDRYYAIVYAVKSRNWRTTTLSLLVCLVVWLVSALISLPFAIFYKTMDIFDDETFETTTMCAEVWPEPVEIYLKGSCIFVVFTTYVVPLSVIIFCYVMILSTLWKTKMTSQHTSVNGVVSKKAQQQEHRRKRVTKLVASVVIVFAIFWLPIHVVNLWLKMDPNFPRTPLMYVFKIGAHSLSYANSCVNPFVYAFLSDGFRKAFKKTFPGLVQKYRICGGPTEDYVTHVGLIDKSEHSKSTMTTVMNNGQKAQLIQTDL